MSNKPSMNAVSMEVYRQLLFDLAMEMSDNGQNTNPHIEKLLALVDLPVELKLHHIAQTQEQDAKQEVSLAVVTKDNQAHIIVESNGERTEIATIAFDNERNGYCFRESGINTPLYGGCFNSDGVRWAGREFDIDTPLGPLHVWAKHPTDEPKNYPGVYIDLGRNKNPENMLTCVELVFLDEDEKYIQTCVYHQGEDTPAAVVIHELLDEPND